MIKFLQKCRRALMRRLKPYTPSTLCWKFRQGVARLRLKKASAKRLDVLRAKFAKHYQYDRNNVLITVSFGCRYLGNRDNLFENFLKTFLAMTDDPKRFEFFIKIDDNDDLLYFEKVYDRYSSKVNLNIIVSPQGRGYQDMHLWHTAAWARRSPKVRALLILSEDASFILKGWDSKLIAQISALNHNFFIGTPVPLDETITIMGPNPVEPKPVYWIRGDDYPILGADILECTEEVAAQYPNWSPLGNLFNVDGFPGDLLRWLWQTHKLNLHMHIPASFQRLGVFCWSENPRRAAIRNETLLKFFEEPTINVRKEMADVIAQEFQKRHAKAEARA